MARCGGWHSQRSRQKFIASEDENTFGDSRKKQKHTRKALVSIPKEITAVASAVQVQSPFSSVMLDADSSISLRFHDGRREASPALFHHQAAAHRKFNYSSADVVCAKSSISPNAHLLRIRARSHARAQRSTHNEVPPSQPRLNQMRTH